MMFDDTTSLKVISISSLQKPQIKNIWEEKQDQLFLVSKEKFLEKLFSTKLVTRVDPLTSILAVLARSCQNLTTSWQPWIPWQDSH